MFSNGKNKTQMFSFFFLAVDNSKTMLGTFSPQADPYTYETKEEVTPTIIFARGSYCVRTKVRFESITKFI